LTSQETTGTAAADDDGPTFQAPGADPVAVKPVEAETAAAPEADEVAETASALPPANTAEEPADTAEEPAAAAPQQEAKPEEQVASVEPMAVTAGAWSVQIASQPSAESAKSTYQDLAKRYGKVIGGRGVNIVKAEIAGKGTYWRVRVPAQSRDEAVKLCGDYKAAGGNCFVSK
jgi:cell division septation protein DedD